MGGIRVGVTGHRRFDDPDAVAAAIEVLIDELAGRSDGPLEVWSSLAEGADRLVASSVLACLGGRLVAVLPLPPADYSTDFEGAASKEQFGGLLENAVTVHMTGPGDDGSRESAYERAGLAVVDAVDVLIAVWDGAESRGRGGTAEIVAAARDRGVDVVVVPVTREGVTS